MSIKQPSQITFVHLLLVSDDSLYWSRIAILTFALCPAMLFYEGQSRSDYNFLTSNFKGIMLGGFLWKMQKIFFFAVQIEKTEKNNLQKEWRKFFFTFYDKEKNYLWISWNLLWRVDSSN